MSSNDDQNSGSNVIDFGRRTGLTGFNLTPIPPSGTGATLGPVIPPQPATPPTTGTGGRTRRSPLDTLAALPSPTLTAPPVVATPHPDGGLPDTFRSPNTGDQVGPRMGALSMAATLAVAVAALRGSCIVLEDWRQRRMAKAAETKPMREARAKHKLAMAEARFGSAEAAVKHANSMQGIGNKSAEKRAKKVPSSQAFGRKTLGSGTAGGGAGGTGKGAGSGSKKSARTGSGSASLGSGGGRTGSSKGKGLFGSGSGGRGTGNTSSSKGGGASPKKSPTPKKKTPKSPHRGSQGAGASLKKNHNGKAPGTGGASGRGSGTKNTPNPSLKKQQPGNKPGGRTTLSQAAARQLGKAAQRRLKNRRKNLNNPALWNSPTTKKNAKGPKAPKPTQPGPGTPPKPKTNLRKPNGATKKQRRAGRTTLAGAMGHSAYQAARTRLKKRRHTGTTPPVWGAAHKPRTKTPPTPNTKKTPKTRRSGTAWAKQHARQAGSWTRRSWQRARTRAQKTTTHRGGFPGSSAGAGSAQQTKHGPTSSGPRTGRKSPFQNAAGTGPASWTVTRDDQPDPAPATGPTAGIGAGSSALPAAPEPHTARPGTTRPKEPIAMPPAPVPAAQDPQLQKARDLAHKQGAEIAGTAGQMDPMHATEITLDDALDEYGKFKDDAFKTHAQSAKLAARAIKLRDTLIDFAHYLAVHHNLIGALFSGAMGRLAESMDLVARMAEEMETSSLQAAEMAEQADNDLNDAYRPISVATADAGLTTPSAPIHNQV